LLGPKRSITGGGAPVPSSVTFMVCAAIVIGAHKAINPATAS